jgi:hypothetical protein
MTGGESGLVDPGMAKDEPAAGRSLRLKRPQAEFGEKNFLRQEDF